MSVVTVSHADLTTEEVTTALRDGLGAGYNVLPGMAMGRTAFSSPHTGRPNMIVVGTNDNKVVKAQVTIIPRDGQTDLRIRPGGVSWSLVLNTFGIARQVRRVLATSSGLSSR